MASLGKDLAFIRKEQNMSLDEIYEVTKIPKRILRSIEDESIFRDFKENPIYIRSYIRSYAKALSIGEKDIVYALNKTEKDDYSGSLQKLLKNKPPQSFQYDDDEEENEEAEEVFEEEPDQSEGMIHDHVPESAPKEEPNTESEDKSASTSKKPDVRSVDWADMGRQFQPLKTAKSRTWVGVLAVFILLIATGGVYYYYFYESGIANSGNQNSANQQEATQTISTDSLELEVVSPEGNDTSRQTTGATSGSIQNGTLRALPDTLHMVLYAAYGKLEPVRVYTDIMDNINPYWIEHGQAYRFDFVNEINIRGQLSRIVLLLNGHLIQNFREQFYNPETRRIEIDRSFFEGDPKWLQPAPDSLAIDAPPLSDIQERPTYN